MSVPVIIIITRPPPTGGRAMTSGKERHEFPSADEAIEFLKTLDQCRHYPTEPGTSEN